MTPTVTICFDDGRESAVTTGAVILEKYNARATFFPITSRVGTSNEHGHFASWKQIEELARCGHEIGNHSHTHDRELVNRSAARQRDDIEEANIILSSHGIKPHTFAYPFGQYLPSLKQTVIDLGFASARTIDHGINTADTDHHLLRSFCLQDKHGLSDLEAELEKTISQNGWLILTFHHLDNKTYISTPPDLLEKMIQKIIETKVQLLPLSDALLSST